MTSWRRRDFLAAAGAGLTAFAARPATGGHPPDSPPTRVRALLEDGEIKLRRVANGRFAGRGVTVDFEPRDDALRVFIEAPGVALRSVTLSWNYPTQRRVLNDHWERTYGDVGWKKPDAKQWLPWYFLSETADGCDAWGVRTGGAALCAWQLANAQRRLIIDTTSGGVGVQLGTRRLLTAEIIRSPGSHLESASDALRAFTRRLCRHPRLPTQPVYGINDWYFAYGRNSDDLIRRHTELLAPFAHGLANRPFSVIDAGWFVGPEGAPDDCCFGHDMITPNPRFRDMAALARDIHRLGMRPGLWTRPLCGDATTPLIRRMPRIPSRNDLGRPILDPTIPENVAQITNYFETYRRWGYELVKIDYTTFDIFGKWGFEMIRDGEFTPRGWRMRDVSRTNAEIIRDLYATMRRAAGDTLLIGCNTISHLSAGVFEINRIGDDTSGKEWDRTRRMGVNALAFRGSHHGHFYAADADCVGLTTAVPWEKNRQWMELVAKSGTPLFISAQPEAVGAEQKVAIREAFALAASARPLGVPLDWMKDAWPREWKFADEVKTFDW